MPKKANIIPEMISREEMERLLKKEQDAWDEITNIAEIINVDVTVTDDMKNMKIHCIISTEEQGSIGEQEVLFEDDFSYGEILQEKKGKLVTDGTHKTWIVGNPAHTVITDFFYFLSETILQSLMLYAIGLQ